MTRGRGDVDPNPGRVDRLDVPLILGDGWYQDRPGGLNRYVADLLAILQELGSEPRCVVIGPAAGAPSGVVPAARLSARLPSRVSAFRRAAGRAGTGCDVVDAHFALNAFMPLHWGPLRKKPLVVHFQGPWADESIVQGELRKGRVALKRAIEASVYRRARHTIVLSQAFKRLLVDRYGVNPWTVEVVPPGVDLNSFVPGDRHEARDRLDLPVEGNVTVAVRRLVPRMGLDVLLRAWAQSGANEARTLVIVGQGPERENLEILAASLDINESVRFLGRVDDQTLLSCYQAADLVVVPSVALEGFGLTVLEALACGTPVIATSSGGLPEVVTPIDPTLVVPPGDAGALADRMRSAMDGSAPLPDAGRCRRHAESYSWLWAGVRHQEIYADAVRPGPRRVRVVYLDHCALLSGGELALLRLLPALSDVDPHVLLAQDGPLVPKLVQAGISVEVLTMSEKARNVHRGSVRPGKLPLGSAIRAAGHTLRVARRLRQLRPDIVHANSLKSCLYGGIAGRVTGVPVVWHVRDRIADDYLPKPAVRLVRALARRLPNGVIANSAATLATLGDPPVPQAIVPSPVAFGRQAPSKGRGPLMASRRRGVVDGLGIGAGTDAATLRIGMIGRLAPWKGQHLFLDAFSRAFPDDMAQAVIIGAALFGESDYEQRLRCQAAHMGEEDRVEFRGFRDDVEAELERLDVFVHASVSPEPFGQVVVEAMAAGLPVVAADAGGPAEVIDHGVTGLLFSPGDVEALAAAMKRLASDPGLRAALGGAARQQALRFTPQAVVPLVMDLYELAATGGAA